MLTLRRVAASRTVNPPLIWAGLLQLFVGDDRLSSTLSGTHCGGFLPPVVVVSTPSVRDLKPTLRSPRSITVIHQMLHGPAQGVEFPDHKRVASAQKGHGIIQAGAFGFDTGNDIFKHGLAARRFECINLRLQLLVCC